MTLEQMTDLLDGEPVGTFLFLGKVMYYKENDHGWTLSYRRGLYQADSKGLAAAVISSRGYPWVLM